MEPEDVDGEVISALPKFAPNVPHDRIVKQIIVNKIEVVVFIGFPWFKVYRPARKIGRGSRKEE